MTTHCAAAIYAFPDRFCPHTPMTDGPAEPWDEHTGWGLFR